MKGTSLKVVSANQVLSGNHLRDRREKENE